MTLIVLGEGNMKKIAIMFFVTILLVGCINTSFCMEHLIQNQLVKKTEAELLHEKRLAQWLIKNPVRRSLFYCPKCDRKVKEKVDAIGFKGCDHVFHKQCVAKRKACPFCFELNTFAEKLRFKRRVECAKNFTIKLVDQNVLEVFDKKNEKTSDIQIMEDNIVTFGVSKGGRFLFFECKERVKRDEFESEYEVKKYALIYDLHKRNAKYTVELPVINVKCWGVLHEQFFVVEYKEKKMLHVFDFHNLFKRPISVRLQKSDFKPVEIVDGRFLKGYYGGGLLASFDLHDASRGYTIKSCAGFVCVEHKGGTVIRRKSGEEHEVRKKIQSLDIEDDRFLVIQHYYYEDEESTEVTIVDLKDDCKIHTVLLKPKAVCQVCLRNNRFFVVIYHKCEQDDLAEVGIFDLRDNCNSYTVWFKPKKIKELCFRKNQFFIVRYCAKPKERVAETDIFDLKDKCQSYTCLFQPKKVNKLDIRNNRFCVVRYFKSSSEKTIEANVFDLQGKYFPLIARLQPKRVGATTILKNRFFMVRYHDCEVVLYDMEQVYRPFAVQLKKEKITTITVKKDKFFIVQSGDSEVFVGDLKYQKTCFKKLQKKAVAVFDIQYGFFIVRYVDNDIMIHDLRLKKTYSFQFGTQKSIDAIAIQKDRKFVSIVYGDGTDGLFDLKFAREGCTIL